MFNAGTNVTTPYAKVEILKCDSVRIFLALKLVLNSEQLRIGNSPFDLTNWLDLR